MVRILSQEVRAVAKRGQPSQAFLLSFKNKGTRLAKPLIH